MDNRVTTSEGFGFCFDLGRSQSMFGLKKDDTVSEKRKIAAIYRQRRLKWKTVIRCGNP